MFRIGYGWDSHEFKPGIPLMIGGVELPFEKGLAGHSDGDVLLHALTDALLGAVAAGDIGAFFPPSDPKWKGANSVLFIEEAMRHIARAGYRVGNCDTTIIVAAPKIGPHSLRIQKRVAELLKVEAECVGIKAKTPEGMGTDNAAIAHAAVLLIRNSDSNERKMQVAEALPQPVVDVVVEKVLEDVVPEVKK
ncbi:MAG TPA: 2-C-methyl-D-erythritol 2,4-cyclodiphosphate synthase [Clostridia bacterium]|nr:2-C-methyl-D-erythritol 2,4-cyclodiphosphate synthase [Clostridia bacterium]